MPISKLVRIFRESAAARPLAVAGTAALIVALTSAPLQTLIANGDTRSLSFAHIHIKETLTVTFKRNGRYDSEALKQLNWYLRDWRNDEVTGMDPHLFDLLWEIHREVGAKGPVTIVSGFRSPQTNSMLRSRGRGVARFSQHMTGKAIDFFIPDADLAQMRAIGLRLQRGGVGYYPRSGAPFMHVDTGGVRHWPRMTRDQLARIFPDGKTVHLPSDGKPMPGYALAKAEIEARGARPVAVAAVGAARTSAPPASRTPIPTATVLSNPSAVSTPPARPAALASLVPPMPQRRPAGVGTLTASLPPAITGSTARTEATTLAYATEPERLLPGFGPIPSTHARIMQAAEPVRPPATTPDYRPEADAARAPAALFAATRVAELDEMHHPELMILRGLVEPARAALRIAFRRVSLAAPATVRFTGPAVVALQTVAFDRGAGIVTGSLTRGGTRAN